ncbi:type IV pilin protein [Neisseriaceae bacterium TC5R-5]|nr:type IV pilin protein [Neisseriaceae bacterium TC5R-5]
MRSTQKSNRAAAKTALLDLAARQESYYALNNAYTNQLSNLSYSNIVSNTVAIPSTSQNYYTLAVSAVTTGTTPSYTLQATPVSGSAQATDSCAIYQLDSYGNRSNITSSGSAVTTTGCW